MTNKKINKLIALHVFQEDPLDCFVLNYATEIQASWLVVEKMKEVGWYFSLCDYGAGGEDSLAEFTPDEDLLGYDIRTASAVHKLTPTAICLAALEAVGAKI